MRVGAFLPVLMALLVAGAIGYGGLRYYRSRQSLECAACHRPADHGARTVALVNGKRTIYCCPSCAVSARQQTGVRVEIERLTDHATGKALPAQNAFLVRGSDVNPCAPHHAAMAGEDKRALEFHYDRCSPSLLAFATREAARAFAAEHGGQVVPFSSLAAQTR